ncbi:MAG: MoaD/ThiS family protein [Opitutaceae bacterium]|nr:MoaD/ThiS family protein [Opitutaceae bacterium]
MARVLIPALLQPLAGGNAEVAAEGASVGEVIRALEVTFPGLAVRLVQDGRLRPGISVAVDGVISHRGLRETVNPASEVIFVAALSGG